MITRAVSDVLTFRRYFVVSVFAVCAVALAWRATDLQLTNREFLQDHGDARYLRVVDTPASRGMIVDRNGQPLAISTPIQSVWAQPRELARHQDSWPALAEIIGTTPAHLEALVMPRLGREFVYLRRHVAPQVAETILAKEFPGVGLVPEQRRYYPAAEVAAHLLGFTNVDDRGQEGIELAFDSMLRGRPGSNKVIKDRLGRIVENVEQLSPAQSGTQLVLSIDKRLQYVAYRELKAAVQSHGAEAGTMVIVDAHSAEVLALVNQPSFNPNNRSEFKGANYRNRAVTDIFEPGSTVKPFTIAAALESGAYEPSTVIDTAPGYFKIGRHKIQDIRNFGRLDVAQVIEKSSNVGASKIALSLEPDYLWGVFSGFGFGVDTGIGLPGESLGRLNDAANWHEIEHATLAFGYGLSVTAVQLARAFTAIAADGLLRPLSITRTAVPPSGRQVISVESARRLREMLQRVISNGTGRAAAVPGYRVAGKTGTVHKTSGRGYAEDRYMSLFAGMLPAREPRLVAIVVIDEPRRGGYFGGKVAAPVFAKVMREAVRIMNVVPDDVERERGHAIRLALNHQGGMERNQ